MLHIITVLDQMMRHKKEIFEYIYYLMGWRVQSAKQGERAIIIVQQSSDDLDLQIKIVIGRSLFDLIADHFLPFF